MWSWTAVGAYCVLIFVLSGMARPIPFLRPEKYPPDWLLHITEYTVLGILLARALGFTWPWRAKSFLLLAAFILGTFYALSDEWHQYFVPYREPGLRDIAADAAGTLAGALLWLQSYTQQKKDTRA